MKFHEWKDILRKSKLSPERIAEIRAEVEAEAKAIEERDRKVGPDTPGKDEP